MNEPEPTRNGQDNEPADEARSAPEDATEQNATDRGALYKSVYSACYYLSFGMVFPTVLVARTIPAPAVVRNGFADGAGAARDSVQHLRQSSGRAVANAAQKYGETVEGIEDRIAEAKFRRQNAAPETA